MKFRNSVALVISVFLLAACAGRTSGPKQGEIAGYAVSNEAITVVEFSLEGAQVNYNEPYDSFGLALAEEIAAALRNEGHTANAVPASGAAAGPIVVTGRVVLIEAGSRATRYFVGFGAGSAKFGVTGTLQNAQGDELAAFSDERWAGFGIFGGNSVSLVQNCLRAVASDVAKMLRTGKYRTKTTN